MTDLAPAFVEYLDARRRANGSFNNTPAADGSDGHVMNTLWGLQALRALGRPGEKKAETVALAAGLPAPGRRLHLPAGAGVRRHGRRRLHLGRGAWPWPCSGHARPTATRASATSGRCGTPTAGSATAPAAPSNPVATYYALDALAALDALDRRAAGPPAGRAAGRRRCRPA